MSHPEDPQGKKPRRDFLMRAGIGAGMVGLGIQGTASLRSLVPNVSYDAPTTVKLGAPGDFPDGLKFLPEERLFVFREGKTFHAISAVCTHLGCTVRAEALPSWPSSASPAASVDARILWRALLALRLNFSRLPTNERTATTSSFEDWVTRPSNPMTRARTRTSLGLPLK